MLHKTKNEVQQDKARSAVEKAVVWLVRWSQVMMIAGFFILVGEEIFILTHLEGEIYALWLQALLYAGGIISVLFMAFGTVVFIYTVIVQERSERREKEKPGETPSM